MFTSSLVTVSRVLLLLSSIYKRDQEESHKEFYCNIGVKQKCLQLRAKYIDSATDINRNGNEVMRVAIIILELQITFPTRPSVE